FGQGGEAIYVRRAVDIVSDTVQDGVVGKHVVHESPRSLDAVVPVMLDPGFAKHLATPSTFPPRNLAPPVVSGEWMIRIGEGEGVRRRAQPDDRLARVREVRDVLNFVGW